MDVVGITVRLCLPAGTPWDSRGDGHPGSALCHCPLCLHSTMLGLSFLPPFLRYMLSGRFHFLAITKRLLSRTGKSLKWARLARDADGGEETGGCLRPAGRHGRVGAQLCVGSQASRSLFRGNQPEARGPYCVDTNAVLPRLPGRCSKGTGQRNRLSWLFAKAFPSLDTQHSAKHPT